MEVKAHKAKTQTERGQSIVLFALILPLMSIFLLGILDYMVTGARVMEGIAISDLSAHAGVQEIKVQPNGMIIPDGNAASLASRYVTEQAPAYVSLSGVWCGVASRRPACSVRVSVRSAGILLPPRTIVVNALAYLVYGVTRGDQ